MITEETEGLTDAMAGGMSLTAEGGGGQIQASGEEREGGQEQQEEEQQVQVCNDVHEEEEDEEEFLLEGAPEDFKCPICFRLMTDPVLAPDGHVSIHEMMMPCV